MGGCLRFNKYCIVPEPGLLWQHRLFQWKRPRPSTASELLIAEKQSRIKGGPPGKIVFFRGDS